MRVARLKSLKPLLAFVSAIIGVYSVIIGLSVEGSRSALASDEQNRSDTDQPLRIRPLVKPLFAISREDYDWVRRQIQPCDAGKLSPSYCLHVLRAHGLDAQFDNLYFPSGQSLLIPLLDTREARGVFGDAALTPVGTGARFLSCLPMNTPRWRESHRDQNLSAFAELGLPRSTKLTIDQKGFSIEDVLNDSVSNFHLKQEEIEWTALAYALYLPPAPEWGNRYSERYSFDDLADELLKRPMIASSCGGIHLLFSLTIIARADNIAPILSPERLFEKSIL